MYPQIITFESGASLPKNVHFYFNMSFGKPQKNLMVGVGPLSPPPLFELNGP